MTFVKGKTDSPNDVIMTPRPIAKEIIDMFFNQSGHAFYGTILDPFMGEGAFYDQFPKKGREWCEITQGRDFFEYKEDVDWIISNPPYSIYKEVLEHSFKLAGNIVYLIPLSKLVSSMGRIRMIKEYGGVPKIWIMSAGKCGFPFGFPACAVYFKRGYKGKTEIIVDKE